MKRTMRLWDVVLMNVTAIIGLRWIPIAAGYGASAIFLWLFAAIMFFIPLGLISSELATTWPDEGGMYVWVTNAYGEGTGFLTSWLYWVTNLFYYPSLLTFIAVTLAMVINPSLADNKLYVCTVVLVTFWTVTALNCKGLRVGKWLSNISGLFGTLLPGLIVIIIGLLCATAFGRPIPTSYALSNWVPNLGNQSNIAFLSALMFAMAGIELTPIMAGETENPQRTFPLATVISAFIIVGVYILGTVAMTFIIAPDKIGAASGIMDAIKLISNELHLFWLLPLVGLLLVVGNFGGISVWIIGPIKLLFESTKKGILPSFITKLNKDSMPQNAMLVQGLIVTFIVITTSFLPSVNSIYTVLVLMTTIIYFIPYIFMFCAFIKLRKKYPEINRPYKVPGGKGVAILITVLGLISVAIALILPFIPSSDLTSVKDIVIYECELGGGPVIFSIIGYILFKKSKNRKEVKA